MPRRTWDFPRPLGQRLLAVRAGAVSALGLDGRPGVEVPEAVLLALRRSLQRLVATPEVAAGTSQHSKFDESATHDPEEPALVGDPGPGLSVSCGKSRRHTQCPRRSGRGATDL